MPTKQSAERVRVAAEVHQEQLGVRRVVAIFLFDATRRDPAYGPLPYGVR